MARQYPRFLFSNPTNTKSKGPFIIHTLEPKFIARIEKMPRSTKIISFNDQQSSIILIGKNIEKSSEFAMHDKQHMIILLDQDCIHSFELDYAIKDCLKWINAQVKSGFIEI